MSNPRSPDIEPPSDPVPTRLAALTLVDALDLDERPTFAIDLDVASVFFELVYCNPALAQSAELLVKIGGQEKGSTAAIFSNTERTHERFCKWVLGSTDVADDDEAHCGNAYLFAGLLWVATTLGRLVIVSGVQHLRRRAGGSRSTPPGYGPVIEKIHTRPRKRPQMEIVLVPLLPTPPSPTVKYDSYDYTLDPPPTVMSDHIRYFRSVDWAQTSLGPMYSWSPQLCCVVNMMLKDSQPAVLFWGPDEVAMVYNEAYIDIIGFLHPCMGASARVVANEYWVHFQPLVDHIDTTGQTLNEENKPIFIDRHGFLEETFFSFQLIPILDSAGYIAGYYQPLVETTINNLLERRVSSLVEIGSRTANTRDLTTWWHVVTDSLRISDKDAPFALLYAAASVAIPDISSVSSPGSFSRLEQCVLKGSIGVEADHPIAPATLKMYESSYIFLPHMLDAAKSRTPTVVNFDDLTLSESMLSGIDWKGYGDPCRSVIICPIMPTTSEHVQGFLILGVNPRRSYDEEYQQFIQVLIRLLATSLASVVLFDEEIRSRENAISQAARIQEQLMSELDMKEKKFQRFAERCDVAIFIIEPQTRKYIYRNQRWYDMFQVDINDELNDASQIWTHFVRTEDLPICEAVFAKLFVDRVPVSFEIKTKLPWTPPAGPLDPDLKPQKHFMWILCSAYVELGVDDEVVEVVGNVTDVSKLKWAAGMQKLRTESALASKKHLESFIDSTSHEMRNPLSAIMQCADGILESCSLPDGASKRSNLTEHESLLEQTLDAALTIAQCAQHMKCIVDDILTISKLDSGLLVITPICAQPSIVASHGVKMFDAEAKAAGVDMTFEVEQSYRDLDVDWVSLDPTRLLQVLINLITNAIKFTRLESTRNISVSVGASVNQPVSTPGGIKYMVPKLVPDAQLLESWEHDSSSSSPSPILHIIFSVQDTGRGLSEEEIEHLFARFSQASPRTHINYGGSGLGLFISRRLTEMQGGAIGLSSVEKRGSTFAFYIRVRRVTSEGIEKRKGNMVDIKEKKKRLVVPAGTGNENMNGNTSTKPMRPPMLQHASSNISAFPRELDVATSGFEEGRMEGEAVEKKMPDPLHILIVEDNIVNQKVLAKQLRKLGCVVSVANHGMECLEFLRGTKWWRGCPYSATAIMKPMMDGNSINGDTWERDRNKDNEIQEKEEKQNNTHKRSCRKCSDISNNKKVGEREAGGLDLHLILLDSEMPVMNGLVCIQRIRALENDGHLVYMDAGPTSVIDDTPRVEDAYTLALDTLASSPYHIISTTLNTRIPVIGVTANIRQSQVQEALDMGMDDVIGKPCKTGEVWNAMAELLTG